MKKIVLRCWFVNSEDFITILMKNYNIMYSKIPDLRQAMGLLSWREDWLLTGEDNIIDSFIKHIENSDYDIEILDENIYKSSRL